MPTVAVPQITVADLDPETNLATIADRLERLPHDVEVVLFPEYELTGFVADDRLRTVALDRDGPELDGLRSLAATHDVGLLAGYVERGEESGAGDGDRTGAGDADGAGEPPATDTDDRPLHNALAYVSPDGETTVYRKRHLWAAEADHLAPGSDRVVVETPVGATGLVTCYELNFVADSAAFAADRVDALFVAGAWPAAHVENWRLLLRARALDGVRWVVGAGRTGARDVAGAPSTRYAGRSTVVRPDGRVAAALGRGERDLVVDLDPDLLAEQREFIPVLDDV
ncbi:carbon-nitrogen hydrolase family protein [Halobacteriales archaeon QS_6_71_20]|nr:MAG: carbon-nitrogen hydrolase family protein [Halobacteriales archaeon QS_6_71_20]